MMQLDKITQQQSLAHIINFQNRGVGEWCLTLLSKIFQLCRDQFYWWKKSRVPKENHRPAASH